MKSINGSGGYVHPSKDHRELDVVSFRVSHGWNSYIYSIHTENGGVLFSAEYESNSCGYKRISVERVAVRLEDMKTLSKLCDEYVTGANLVDSDQKADSNLDAEVEIVWENAKRFKTVIGVWSVNKNKAELMFIAHVLSFFDGLTRRFDEFYFDRPSAELTAEGSVVLAHYSEGGTRSVSYELREDCGDFLFDADTYLDVVEAGGEEIILRDEDVTREDMDKFNALCEEHNFAKQQIRAASEKKSYYEPPWRGGVFEELCKDIGFVSAELSMSLVAVWENGARYSAYTLPDGMAEAVCGFFMSLVKRIQTESVKRSPEGRIVSLRLSHATITEGMRKGHECTASKRGPKKDYGYSFHLREEGGELLFGGRCLFRDITSGNFMDRELKVEKIQAAPEDMGSLQKICKEKSLVEKWHSYPKAKIADKKFIGQRAGDIGRHRLEVIWENGARLDARLCYDTDIIPSRELKSFFSELAKRLDKTLPAEGRLVSFKLKGAYSARFAKQGRFISDMRGSIWGNQGNNDLLTYEYHMREEEGKAQFSACQSDHPLIVNSYSSRNQPIPSVENKHLEALRALCERHDFAGKIQDYHRKRWDDFYRRDLYPTDTSSNPNYDFFEIEWENGARCEGTSLSDEFREFFFNMVASVLPLGSIAGAAVSKESWACACGNTGNNGKFCTECGKPKPEDSKWKCSCGEVNKGRFCNECGAPRVWD